MRLALTIWFRCDFADIFDVKSGRVVSRGATASRWLAEEARLETVHTNATFRRGLSVRPSRESPRPTLRDGALSFIVELKPQALWQAELEYQVVDGEELLNAPKAAFAGRDDGSVKNLGQPACPWRADRPG